MHVNYNIMRQKIIKVPEREFRRESRMNVFDYMTLWNKNYRSQLNKNEF